MRLTPAATVGYKGVMVAPHPQPGSPVVLACVLQVAREAGMDPASLRDLCGGDTWSERGRIWSRIMRTLRVDGFPIRVAQRYSAGEIGPLGMSAQVAPNLGEALRRMIRHHHVLTGTCFARMRDDVERGTSVFELLPIEGTDLAGRCRREEMIASGLKLARDISRTWIRPTRVCFAHPAPRDTSEHEAFFDCEVRFDADYDGLELERSTLSIPIAGADPLLSHLLIEHLQAIAGDGPVAALSLEGRVRQAISRRLGSEVLSMAAVARELGMSSRTLRRRLLEQARSYHEILDCVRRELADELLRAPEHKLSEVASLLGFSDASAFHRAYVRWTGRTPASNRRAASGGA